MGYFYKRNVKNPGTERGWYKAEQLVIYSMVTNKLANMLIKFSNLIVCMVRIIVMHYWLIEANYITRPDICN